MGQVSQEIILRRATKRAHVIGFTVSAIRIPHIGICMESSVSAMHIEQQSGLPEYAELSAASHFSFLRGASAPESLVAQAAALGYHALALTDECSLAGIVRAHVEAKKIGLKILVGSELRITPKAYGSFRIILLAQNREGYGNLCETITRGRMQAPKGQYLLQPDDVLTQYCLAVLIPDYFATPQELDQRLQWLKTVCPAVTNDPLIKKSNAQQRTMPYLASH
jgi:DNA polymerase III alpha subunit